MTTDLDSGLATLLSRAREQFVHPASRGRADIPMIPIPGSAIVQVPNPTADYYHCVGLLLSYVSNGDVLVGTGTLIDSAGGVGILTCAHNLYDEATNRAALWTVFLPGFTLGAAGDAVLSAGQDQMFICPAYHGATSAAGPNDYAVVKLNRADVPTGLAPMPSIQTIPGDRLARVQVTGYPNVTAPDPNPAMYYSRGTARLDNPDNPRMLYYQASTLNGSSGSGVVRTTGTGAAETPEMATITAVHVGFENPTTGPFNKGVYLTTAVIEWIDEQITP